jgi:hypothetical protein
VVSALYASDDLMRLSGRALIGAELAARLGVTDIDGGAPYPFGTNWAARRNFIPAFGNAGGR